MTTAAKPTPGQIERIFSETGDFAAITAAENWLKAAGFSIGSMERGEPMGLMFGDFIIAKWRNLREFERKALHGTITGVSKRDGPVTVTIFATAPDEARAALKATR